jgi:hypothetical protein
MNRTFMQLAVLAIVSVAIACTSPPKGTDVGSVPKGTDVASAPKEPEVVSAPVSDVAYLSAPLEAGDVFAVVDSAPGHGGGPHKAVSADSAPGHGGGGHAKARDNCYYDTKKKEFVCDFHADSAPGHGGGPHKAVSADSAPGHGGGPHKVALLMECTEKEPKRVECTAPVPKR